MDSPAKEDCKYGDKCYQKNDQHRQKYNHPKPPQSIDEAGCSILSSDSDVEEVCIIEDNEKKRKFTGDSDDDDDVIITKRSNSQRLWLGPNRSRPQPLKNYKFFHTKFLVKMPSDFYQFWDFNNSLTKGKHRIPLSLFDLELVGPFDYMSGKFTKEDQKSPGEYLRHWRFYYDPPEFQTIFVKKGTGIHYGYWRDDPKDETNIAIARNDAEKGCTFDFVATSCFDALAYFLEKDFKMTPFLQQPLIKIRKAINEFVSANAVERKPLQGYKNDRLKGMVAKTFHGAGIVISGDKKTTVGYRPLIESDANIKKILSILDEEADSEAAKEKVIEQLQPIITASVIALDECDFGTNLELGIDLFCSGHKQLHPIIQSLLVPAYTLLERPQLLAILKAHLDDRRKSFNLSILT